MQGKVKPGQIEGSSGLPLVELLGGSEILEGFVIHPDLKLQLGPFKEVLPFFQCSDNGYHFFVVDLIVPFYRAETLGEEHNKVPLSILRRLL